MADQPKIKWVNGIACLPDEPKVNLTQRDKLRQELIAAMGMNLWEKLLYNTRTWAKRMGFRLPEVLLVERAATILGQELSEEAMVKVQQKLFADLVKRVDGRRPEAVKEEAKE